MGNLNISHSDRQITITPNVKLNLSSILTCGVSFMWSRIRLSGSPVTALRHLLWALKIQNWNEMQLLRVRSYWFVSCLACDFGLGGHSQLNLGNRHSKRSLAGTFAIQSQFQSQQLSGQQWHCKLFPHFLWTQVTPIFISGLKNLWTQGTPNFSLRLFEFFGHKGHQTFFWFYPLVGHSRHRHQTFFQAFSIVWTQATQNLFFLFSKIFGHKWHQTFFFGPFNCLDTADTKLFSGSFNCLDTTGTKLIKYFYCLTWEPNLT